MIRAALLALGLLALPAAASETIVAGLSQSRVSITANFDGSEILIYGAVKRDAPFPDGPPLQVIVTVEGPSTPLIIRRKERSFGIWLNRSAVTIDRAPSFYVVATSAPLARSLTETENQRHGVTLDYLIRAVGITAEAEGAGAFVEALRRIRLNNGQWRVEESRVLFTEQTLFRSDVVLPANLIEGDYRVRVFLTRGGRVVDHLERTIGVRKAGLERFLFVTAHDQPFLYGLASLLLAAVAGWAANAGFKLLRR